MHNKATEEPVVEEPSLNADILSNNMAAYELLFELMEINNEGINEKAWNLIQKLPTNPQWSAYIEKLEDAQGSIAQLNVKNGHQILYIMEIMNSFMTKENNITWVNKFLLSGWVDFLVDVISLKYFQLTNLKEKSQMLNHSRKSLNFASKFLSFYIASYSFNTSSKFQELTKMKDTMTIAICKPVCELFEKESMAAFLKTHLCFNNDECLNRTKAITNLPLLNGIMSTYAAISAKQVYYELDFEDVVQLLYLWICTIYADPSLLAQCFVNKECSKTAIEFLLNGLQNNKLDCIRLLFSSIIYILSFVYEKGIYYKHFSSEIITLLISSENMVRFQCGEYFELCQYFLDECLKNSKESKEFQQLAINLCNQIKTRTGSDSSSSSDKVIIGWINVLMKLLGVYPHLKEEIGITNGLINYLFYECLFIHPSLQKIKQPNFQSNDAVYAAYNILLIMTDRNAACLAQFINNCVAPLASCAKENMSFDFALEKEERSSVGLIGYKNLGCICYMISMLQQFFMIEPFRNMLLLTVDNIPPTKGDYDDNVLHQLQLMFAFSMNSLRRDYNPAGFCFAFKDQSGKPTSFNIQQDAYEFVNCFFSRLETVLKPTENKYLVQSIFGGKTTKRLACQSCNAVKCNSEDTYNLSLEVKNLKNLEESLKKYISGEIISGYLCESCNQKTNIEAKHLLSQLPNILLIHLQRIVFNFDTYLNEKINSKFEFPKQLNVREYTDSTDPNLKDENFAYKLIGVVIHYGNADAGHYYSIVQLTKYNIERWVEINDSSVKDFSNSQFEKECFGGVDFEDVIGPMDENQKNAYMLVYEKVIKSPIKVISVNESTKEEAVNLVQYSQPLKSLPEFLEKVVSKDNLEFLLEKQLYSIGFSAFIKKSICFVKVQWEQIPNALQEACIDLYLRLYIDVIVYIQNEDDITQFGSTLSQLCQSKPQLLEMHFHNITTKLLHNYLKVLITCSRSSFREELKNILFSMVAKLQFERKDIHTDVKILVDSLITSINYDLTCNWAKFNEFFSLLRRCADYPPIVAYLISQSLISKLIDFYLEKESQLYKKGDKRYEMGNKSALPNFYFLIDLIACLMSHCYNLPYTSKQPKEGLYEMAQIDYKLVCDKKLYKKIFCSGYSTPSFLQLLSFWCNNCMAASHKLVFILMKVCNSRPYGELSIFMPFFVEILKIEDQFSRQRFEWIIGIPMACEDRDTSLPISYTYGQAKVNSEQEEVFELYPPTIQDLMMAKESLLVMICKCKMASKAETAKHVGLLYDAMKQSPSLKKYIEWLPYSTLTCSGYLDWMKEFVDEYFKTEMDLKTEIAQQERCAFEYAKEKINELSLNSSIYTYILGNTVSQREIKTESKNGVELHIWALSTYIYPGPYSKEKLINIITTKRSQRYSVGNAVIYINGQAIQTPKQEEKKSMDLDQIINSQPEESKASTNVLHSVEKQAEEPTKQAIQESKEVVLKIFLKKCLFAKFKVYFKITVKQEVNFYVPETMIKVTLDQNTTEKNIFTTIKIDPQKDWGAFDVEWGIIEAENDGSDFEDFVLNKRVSIDMPENMIVENPCPKCTYMNPETAEICGSCLIGLK